MRRRRLISTFTSVSLVGLAGCFGESTEQEEPPIDLSAYGPLDGWAMYRADPRHTGRSGTGPDGTPEEAWTMSLQHRTPYRPVVAGDALFVGERDTRIAAVDPIDGDLLAENLTPEYAARVEPVVVDGTLYYGTETGEVIARDLRGSGTAWRAELPKVADHDDDVPLVVDSTPAVAADRAFVSGIEPGEGSAVFCFRTDGPSAGDSCEGWPLSHGSSHLPSPVVDDDLVVVQYDETLIAFDTTEVARRWEVTLPDLDGDTAIDPTPALGPDRLYVRTHAGLRAHQREDGAAVWTREAGGDTGGYNRLFRSYPAAVEDGVVYAGFLDGAFEALDSEGGEVLWAFEPDEDTVFWTAPALDDECVYVGAHGPRGNVRRPDDVDLDDARFYALDRNTGEVVAEIEREGELSDPAVGAGGVYVAFGTVLVAFR